MPSKYQLLPLCFLLFFNITASAMPQLMHQKIDKQLNHILDKAFLSNDSGKIRYIAKEVNLNGNINSEIIVYAMGSNICGSGGCPIFIFSQQHQHLKLISWISITNPPIIVSNTKTNGWRDIIVTVMGGGIIQGYEARLQFNGKSYPTNPSVKPAKRVSQPIKGKTIIKYSDFSKARFMS